MYFNAPRMQQRVPIKQFSWGGACPPCKLWLRRSIGKFQFFLTKLNSMPDIQKGGTTES